MAKTENTAIRPFRVNVPEPELADLRRRMQRDQVADPGTGYG